MLLSNIKAKIQILTWFQKFSYLFFIRKGQMCCLHHKEFNKRKTLVSTREKLKFLHEAKSFFHYFTDGILAICVDVAYPYLSD